MTLRPVNAFSIHCDRCGEQFEDGDYTIFCVDSDLNFDDHDWWARDSQHYCPGCHTRRWPTDEEYEAGAEDELIRAVKPDPEPHPLVRNPRWTRPTPAPGESCVADGCGLRAVHPVHTGGEA